MRALPRLLTGQHVHLPTFSLRDLLIQARLLRAPDNQHPDNHVGRALSELSGNMQRHHRKCLTFLLASLSFPSFLTNTSACLVSKHDQKQN